MRLLGLALLAAALAAPGAAADGPAADGCAAPCGWINPIIRLDFPDKPTCGAGRPAAELDRSTCLPLPAAGESVTLQGTLAWYWDMSNEGTYPNDPVDDIEITFSGTASNPDWLEFAVEPDSFTLGTADLFNPAYFKVDDSSPPQVRLFFWYERPITLTVTRTGDPDAASLDRIDARDGIASVFVKAKSTESSDRFKAAFGVEEVRFDARAGGVGEAPSRDAPAPGLAVAAAAVAVAAAFSRRR